VRGVASTVIAATVPVEERVAVVSLDQAGVHWGGKRGVVELDRQVRLVARSLALPGGADVECTGEDLVVRRLSLSFAIATILTLTLNASVCSVPW